ncbi:MAG: hypothetical protein ACUVQG_14895 [Thermogutta sp.]
MMRKGSYLVKRKKVLFRMGIVIAAGAIWQATNAWSEEASSPEPIVAAYSYPEPCKIVASVIVPEFTGVAKGTELG